MASVEIRLMDGAIIGRREQEAIRIGERVRAGGRRYQAEYVTWGEDGSEVVHVRPLVGKGAITVEPGFLERDDMPKDKGREGS